MVNEYYIPLEIQHILSQGVMIDGDHLTINDVVAVARFGAKVSIHQSVARKVESSRKYVENAAKHATDPNIPEDEKLNSLIYGITTGFGNFKNFPVESLEEAKKIQENIIFSHAVGVGDHLSSEIVRAMILLRTNAFAKGNSGVRYQLLEFLIELLNNNVHPVIPEQGSVGASGDLAALAHMSLVLLGKGRANIDMLNKKTGQWGTIEQLPGNRALERIRTNLKKKGIRIPFELSFKEGLALTNGTNMMTAIGVLNYYDSVCLIKHADIAAALTLEGIAGRSRPFDAKVHEVRPHPGQIACAGNIRKLIQESRLIDKNKDVQNSYSIRCIPQVHGASKDTIDYVGKVLQIELNSVTDNPIFFDKDENVIDGKTDRQEYSAGNYHGQPIALAMDFLAVALSEIGNISERRIQKLLDGNHNNGLPTNLIHQPGINSGLMLLQYTAAALVSENKVLAHPASVDSIPTSANIEDHVSMGPIASRKALKILNAVQNVIAIELVCAAQALDFRVCSLEFVSDDKIYVDEAIRIRHSMLDSNIPNVPQTEQLIKILTTQNKIKKICIENEEQLGKGTKAAYQVIRHALSPILRDDEQELHFHIEKAKDLMITHIILHHVENAVGKLYT